MYAGDRFIGNRVIVSRGVIDYSIAAEKTAINFYSRPTRSRFVVLESAVSIAQGLIVGFPIGGQLIITDDPAVSIGHQGELIKAALLLFVHLNRAYLGGYSETVRVLL